MLTSLLSQGSKPTISYRNFTEGVVEVDCILLYMVDEVNSLVHLLTDFLNNVYGVATL